MKKTLLFIIFIIFYSNGFAQKKQYIKEKIYSCNQIKNHVVDSSLYDKLKNGKLIFNTNLNSTKIYRIVINDKDYYYISKNLVKVIKRSIRKNKCNSIKVRKVKNSSDLEIHRD